MAESFSVEAILSATDKNMTSTMNKALGTVESFGSKVKAVVAGIGITKAVGATMNVLSSSLDGAITRFDTLQSYPKVMNSLGFSTEDAQASVIKLNESVQGLPTSLADVVTTAKSLTSVTGNISKATDTTIALNHAFLASGSSSEDASRGLQQYSQMLAKGTVDLTSWRTLQETMAPSLSKVAKKLGIASGSANELYDALQEGTITFDQFNDALIECDQETGGFADTALEASKGISTSMTNIKSAVQNLEMSFLSAMNKMTNSEAGKGIVDFLEGIKSKIYEVRNAFMQTSDGGLTWEFKPEILDKVSQAFNYLRTNVERVQSVVESFFKGFASTGVFDSLAQTLTDITDKFDEFMSEIGQTGVFKNVGETIGNAIKGFVDAFNDVGVIDKFKDTMLDVSEAISHIAEALNGSGISADLGNSIGQIAEQALISADNIANFIKNLKPSTIKTFAKAIKDLAYAFVAVKIGNGIVSKIKSIGDSCKSAKSKVDSFVDALKKIKNKGVGTESSETTSTPTYNDGISEQIDATANQTSKGAQMIQSAFEGIGNVIEKVCNGAKGIIEGFGNSIKSVFEGIGTVIESAGNAISNVFTGLGQGIKSALEGVGTVIESLGNAVSSVATGIGQGLATAFTGLGTAIAMVPPTTWLALSVAILAVGVAMALVASQGEGFKAILEGVAIVIQALVPVVQTVVDGIVQSVQTLPQIFESMGEGIKSALEGVGTVVESFGEAVKSAFDGVADIITAFGDAVQSILEGVASVIDSIGNSAKKAGEGFKSLAQGVKIITNLPLLDMTASLTAVAVAVGKIATSSSGLGDAGTQMMSLATALQMIISCQVGLDALSASLPTLVVSITQLGGISETLASASTAFTTFGSAITSCVTQVLVVTASITALIAVAMTISSAFTSASTSAVTALNSISTAMDNLVSKASTSGQTLGTNFASGLKSGLDTAKSTARSTCNQIINVFNSCTSRAEYCGRMIGQGLANGLSASASAVYAQAERLAQMADKAIQAKAKIGSPSRVQKQNGIWFAQGLVNGMKAMEGKVKQASEDLLYLPNMAMSTMSFGYDGSMNGQYEYTSNNEFVIETPLYINDKEFARATSRATQDEINRATKFNSRLRGNV